MASGRHDESPGRGNGMAERPDAAQSRRASALRFVLGALAYPAACGAALVLVSGRAIAVDTVVLVALPGIVFGAIVGRPWILGVPVTYVTAWLLIDFARDPTCANSCGQDDTWGVLGILAGLYLVLPQLVMLLLGMWLRTMLLPGRRHNSERQRRELDVPTDVKRPGE